MEARIDTILSIICTFGAASRRYCGYSIFIGRVKLEYIYLSTIYTFSTATARAKEIEIHTKFDLDADISGLVRMNHILTIQVM